MALSTVSVIEHLGMLSISSTGLRGPLDSEESSLFIGCVLTKEGSIQINRFVFIRSLHGSFLFTRGHPEFEKGLI